MVVSADYAGLTIRKVQSAKLDTNRCKHNIKEAADVLRGFNDCNSPDEDVLDLLTKLEAEIIDAQELDVPEDGNTFVAKLYRVAVSRRPPRGCQLAP